MAISIGEFSASAARALREGGIAEADLKMAWWLEHHTKIPRLELTLAARDPLPEHIGGRWLQDLPRLLAHEPWQVVLGVAAFFDMDLEVTPDVLIPRPETEQLVELVLSCTDHAGRLVVWDVGTGSGCIALALARMNPHWVVTGVDVSEAALAVARRNAHKVDVSSVRWMHSNLLEAWQGEPLDLVVANLPYIGDEERDTLPPEVLREPALALFAPEQGLALIHALATQALTALKPGGMIALEIGESQGNPLLVFLHEVGYCNIRLCCDYAGRSRFIIAYTPIIAHTPINFCSHAAP